MNRLSHRTHLLALLALALCAALSACDDRLPRPFEPTTPNNSGLAERPLDAILGSTYKPQ